MPEKTILWDFDGTLGERPGMWRSCLIDVLDEHEEGHGIDADLIRPFLRDGFPWHTPEIPHPELSTQEAWWTRVGALLTRAYEGVGISPDRAGELGRLATKRYADTRYWRLYEDSIPALSGLREDGWRHIILSNHVPELQQIVDGLGLGPYVDETINSAVTGYEKPHPKAFALAREAAGDPPSLWMVGDNPIADIQGAEAAGIPGILVCRSGVSSFEAPRTIQSLEDVAVCL